MTRYILIGTAGHIDHGKTRLVQRLTGIDTDRLPEEKARGISIDLGFAHWQVGDFLFGIVDVPGHERFIKNMVAGASGVDMAILVVAADDSVMPQTREHLEIMQLLGLKAGLVAITKTDLVDPELLELVEADVRELTESTFLEGCPIVPVSSATGEGFEKLERVLVEVARRVEAPRPVELFRLPIDRALSIPGHGTVVTGSVMSGEVHPGDALELLPIGRLVRVRGVQNYGMPTQGSGPGRRTAINLAGVPHGEIVRGMELATPGYLRPTRRLVVRLEALPSSPIGLKDRMEFSLHLGTAEVPARLVLKGRTLKPGESGFAELRCQQPIVATHGQRFILRRPSPAITVAGGKVLDPGILPGRRIRDLSTYATGFDSPNDEDRLAALLEEKDSVPDDPLEAAWRAGVSPSRYREVIEQLVQSGVLAPIGAPERPLLIHRRRWQLVRRAVLRTVRNELAKRQPRRSLPKATLLTAC
ncbi:MAG TPA: selenocysteine-specific translation elongation factor, partial [Planctomycetaceae bacterium]|nr:selenocysteine-specific translation elongation factor [Planctomycetaceae bacterium]